MTGSDAHSTEPRPIGAWIFFGLVLAAAAVILLSGEGRLADLLAYRPDLLRTHDYWRIIGGHLSHLGWPHLALNALGLASILLLYDRTLTTFGWMALFFGLCLFTTAGYIVMTPEVRIYLGLSAVLHGMLAAAVPIALSDHFASGSHFTSDSNEWPIDHIVIGIGLLLKLLYEAFVGAVPLTETLAGGRVATQAHLYGATGGLVTASLVIAYRRMGFWLNPRPFS